MKKLSILLFTTATAILLTTLPAGAVRPAAVDTRVLKDEFFTAAEQYITSHAPWKDSEITLKRNYVREMEVPAGADIRLEARTVQHSKPWGKVLVPITVYKDRQEWRRVHVYMNVNMISTVAIAVKNIRHNEPLSEKNCTFIRMPLSRVPHTSILKKADLANTRAKGSIMAGKVITSRMVEPVPVVKKGERVSLKVNRQGFTVTSMGRARQDGFLGEKIRVVNVRSNKQLVGTVTAPGVIEINN